MSVTLLGHRRHRVVAAVQPEDPEEPPPDPEDWQLPAGHFEPAVMAMHVVYPRPNDETPSWARHRHAYPGIAYRIPIVVQGGAFPFRYEVLAGPSGMAIGETLASADYGVLTWTPAGSSGPHAVTVRVTDQELNYVDVTFSVTAATAPFVFLDPSVSSSGDGSISNPFKTWPDVFGSAPDHSANSGKILVLREGTHTMVGFASTNGNLRLRNAQPMAWIAYPGESPVVNCSGAFVSMFDGANPGDDFFCAGIAFADARTTTDHARFFFLGGGYGNRLTWHEVAFSGLARGTVGNDNPGAIVMFSDSNFRQHFACIRCTLDDFDAPLVIAYKTKHAVLEECTLGATSETPYNHNGVYVKEANTRWSVRRNRSVTSNHATGAIGHSFSAGGVGDEPLLIEFCYNLLCVPTITEAAAFLDWGDQSPADSNAWWYRNTFVGRVMALSNPDRTVHMTRNVVVNNDASPANSSNAGTFVLTENLTAAGSALGDLLDAEYLLTGTARAEYLGTRGHEISAGV